MFAALLRLRSVLGESVASIFRRCLTAGFQLPSRAGRRGRAPGSRGGFLGERRRRSGRAQRGRGRALGRGLAGSPTRALAGPGSRVRRHAHSPARARGFADARTRRPGLARLRPNGAICENRPIFGAIFVRRSVSALGPVEASALGPAEGVRAVGARGGLGVGARTAVRRRIALVRAPLRRVCPRGVVPSQASCAQPERRC